MSALASASPLLATLSSEQVTEFLLSRGLEVYATSGIEMNGASLAALTTSMLVKKSAYKSIGDGVSRSLLAKEIRSALTPSGDAKLKAMFFGNEKNATKINFTFGTNVYPTEWILPIFCNVLVKCNVFFI